MYLVTAITGSKARISHARPELLQSDTSLPRPKPFAVTQSRPGAVHRWPEFPPAIPPHPNPSTGCQPRPGQARARAFLVGEDPTPVPPSGSHPRQGQGQGPQWEMKTPPLFHPAVASLGQGRGKGRGPDGKCCPTPTPPSPTHPIRPTPPQPLNREAA